LLVLGVRELVAVASLLILILYGSDLNRTSTENFHRPDDGRRPD